MISTANVQTNKANLKIRKEANEKSFGAIYALSLQLCGISNEVAPCSKGALKRWKDLAAIWDKHMSGLSAYDVFYAALYHITYMKHKSSVKQTSMKELVILVEKELLCDSYAFDAWRTCPDFQSAFQKILLSTSCCRYSHSGAYSKYLYSRVLSKVIYKDHIPDAIMLYSSTYNKRRFYKSSGLNFCYRSFELAITRILPEAALWTSEWGNEKYITDCLRTQYGIDYLSDPKEFDALIHTIVKILTDDNYCDQLIRIKHFPFILAQAIWGDDAEKQIQRCFSTICSKHKGIIEQTKYRHMPLSYSRNNILRSGLFQLVDSWRESNDPRLSSNTKKRLFELMLGD